MRQGSTNFARRMFAFVGNNPSTALIIPLTVLTVLIAALVGEQDAIGYLNQRSASLQADFSKPLNYGDLDASQVTVLVLIAFVAMAIPAYRFYQFLKSALADFPEGQ
jgi:hypothetical protein